MSLWIKDGAGGSLALMSRLAIPMASISRDARWFSWPIGQATSLPAMARRFSVHAQVTPVISTECTKPSLRICSVPSPELSWAPHAAQQPCSATLLILFIHLFLLNQLILTFLGDTVPLASPWQMPWKQPAFSRNQHRPFRQFFPQSKRGDR